MRHVIRKCKFLLISTGVKHNQEGKLTAEENLLCVQFI